MMPDVDGLELCRRIRAEEESGFAYIVLVTARARRANYRDAMDSGVDDFSANHSNEIGYSRAYV